MKSFIQTFKLTEPITPAEKSKSVSKQSQSKQNNTNASAEKNAFKSMLHKQVQDRQLENQRTQQRQMQNKADEQQNQQAIPSELLEANMNVIEETVNVAVNAGVSIKDPQEASIELLKNTKSAEAVKDQKERLDAPQLDLNALQDNGEIAKGKILKVIAPQLADEKLSTVNQPFIAKEVDLVTQQALASMQQTANQTQLNPQSQNVQDEASVSTIDVMLSQKLAADLRKKSIDKAAFSKDLNMTFHEDVIADDGLVDTKSDGVSERLMTEKGSSRGQQFAQGFSQQMGQTQVKPRDTSVESHQFKVNNLAVDSQSLSQNGLAGQMSTQVASAVSNMQNNTQQVAASNQIYTPFNNRAGWNQAVNQRVMYMIGASEQSATLTLNPPDLGPLQVVINVNNEQADTTFFSDDPNVRQALEDGMADLRDKMNEAGISLGQANVNTGQQFEQPKSQENLPRVASNRPNLTAQASSADADKVIVREQNGLVDIFA